MVKVVKLNLYRNSEASFNKDLKFKFKFICCRDADAVWLRF